MSGARLGLFAAQGVELEYMIVDRKSLAVRPIADQLLRQAAGAGDWVSDVEHDDITWSNELVAHLIELKTTDPAPKLAGLGRSFAREVREIDRQLEPLGARLMPTAMHPWMNPLSETQLWPHDYGEVYAAFDRVFGCQGHGWSNVQSVHLNLPFADDAEFARLHAAIRLVLPILPAVAASSPVVEGRLTGWLDSRLDAYRANSRKVPSVAGRVIPEPVYSQADYRREIFERIYADIAPHDPDGILQDEWLNARGAIARFGRGTIEVRVIDVQECPLADLSILAATVAVIEALVAERFTSLAEQQRWPVEPLAELFLSVAQHGDQAKVADVEYLRTLGLQTAVGCTAGELWRHLFDVARQRWGAGAEWNDAWNVLGHEGPLARRIVRRVAPNGSSPSHETLTSVYRSLCDCLVEGRMFV